MSEEKKKEGWYPGKFVGRAMRRSSATGSSDQDSTKGSETTSRRNSDFGRETTISKDSNSKKTSTSNLNVNLNHSITTERKPIAKIKVTVNDIKYLTTNFSSLIISVNGHGTYCPIFPTASSNGSVLKSKIEKELPIYEIFSDLRFEFYTSATNDKEPTGHFLLPITNCLNFTGNVVPINEEWKEIYPVYNSKRYDFESKFQINIDDVLTSSDKLHSNPLNHKKFYGIYTDLNGTGMNYVKQPLGFLNFSLEILPWTESTSEKDESDKDAYDIIDSANVEGSTSTNNQPTVAPKKFNLLKYYLKKCNKLRPNNTVTINSSGITDDEGLSLLYKAKFNRDVERLKNLFHFPLILLNFLTFPEIFILITITFFIIYSFHISAYPLVFFFIVLSNGLYTRHFRNFSSISFRNEPGITTITPTFTEDSDFQLHRSVTLTGVNSPSNSNSTTTSSTPNTKYFSIPNELMIHKLSNLVHNLEVFFNLFTFADDRVSVIVYLIYFIFSFISSLIIFFFSFRFYIFIILSFTFILFTLLELVSTMSVNNQVLFNYNDDDVFINIIDIKNSDMSLLLKVFTIIDHYKLIFLSLLSRCPDQLELIHRYISSQNIISEKGGEFFDARIEFNKNKDTSSSQVPPSPPTTKDGSLSRVNTNNSSNSSNGHKISTINEVGIIVED